MIIHWAVCKYFIYSGFSKAASICYLYTDITNLTAHFFHSNTYLALSMYRRLGKALGLHTRVNLDPDYSCRDVHTRHSHRVTEREQRGSCRYWRRSHSRGGREGTAALSENRARVRTQRLPYKACPFHIRDLPPKNYKEILNLFSNLGGFVVA